MSESVLPESILSGQLPAQRSSNQLVDILAAWQQGRDDADWVLGTVYRTQGSAYRKAGALMLINSRDEAFGMLSGGCLESDIVSRARQVMVTGEATTIVYDGSDEDDLSFQLGIGCGGKVFIMLQAITGANDLDLADLARSLATRQGGLYRQRIGANEAVFEAGSVNPGQRAVIRDGWLLNPVEPQPHLLVVGGGIDARPVVSIAKQMGWWVSLCDPRPANARAEFFPDADRILRAVDVHLADYVVAESVDAAVLMSHSVDLDASALSVLQPTPLRYLALLGPGHRFQEVMETAGLTEQSFHGFVSGPAGLDIGGQLPESIALSILAECHSVLYQRSAKSHQHHLAAVKCL